jgi:hypothetical protein
MLFESCQSSDANLATLGCLPLSYRSCDMSTFRTSKNIHPKVKEVIVQLSYWINTEELAFYLGVHPRTVNRICQIFEETGEVIQPSPEVRGRPRLLNWEQGMVSCNPS